MYLHYFISLHFGRNILYHKKKQMYLGNICLLKLHIYAVCRMHLLFLYMCIIILFIEQHFRLVNFVLVIKWQRSRYYEEFIPIFDICQMTANVIHIHK